jgi:hypothetical protein
MGSSASKVHSLHFPFCERTRHALRRRAEHGYLRRSKDGLLHRRPLDRAVRAAGGELECAGMNDKRILFLAHSEARKRAQEAIWAAPGGYKVTIEPPKRTLEINAALHATLGEIADRVPWAGKLRNIEAWKRLMVAAWLRAVGEQVEFLPAIDGHGVDVVFRRTSEMTQAEVRDLLAYVEAWAAERPEMQA